LPFLLFPRRKRRAWLSESPDPCRGRRISLNPRRKSKPPAWNCFSKASLFKEALKGYEELLLVPPASASYGCLGKLGRARAACSVCGVTVRRYKRSLSALPALAIKRGAAGAGWWRFTPDKTTRRLPSRPFLRFSAIDAQFPRLTSRRSITAGNLFFRPGDWQNAGRQYQTLVESFPQGAKLKNAQWRLIWCYYLSGAHDQARKPFGTT